MKVLAVFTLLLAVQASASFFDKFPSAFVSVENSFGKLLSDVVSDVKVTIDCTVVAVENALSLGGLFGDHSEYQKRCRGESAYNQPTIVPNTVLLVTPTAIYDRVTVPPVYSEKQSLKREIQVANIHNTIKDIIGKARSLDGLESVKTTLKKDVTVLDHVGSSLTKQLDDITSNVKREVKQTGRGSASTVKEMLDKINTLHKVTEQKSDAENSQIRHAFDEVMDAIHSNSTAIHLANNDTATEIMKNLEQTSNNTFTDIKTTYSQFKNEENKHLDDLKDIVENKTKDLLKTKSKDTVNKVMKSYDLKDLVEMKTKNLLKTKPKESINKGPDLYDLKDIVESKTRNLLKNKPKESVNRGPNSYDLKDIVESKTGILLKTKLKESVNEGPNSYDLKDIFETKAKDLLKTEPKKSLNGIPKSYDLKDIVDSKTKDLLKTKLKKYVNEGPRSYDLKDIIDTKVQNLLKTKPKESLNEVTKSYDLKDIVVSETKDLHKIKPNQSVNETPKSYDLKDIVDSETKDLHKIKPNQSVNETPKSYDLKDIVDSETKNLLKTKLKESVDDVPKSFKTLAQQMMDEKPNIVSTMAKTTIESITEVPTPSTNKPEDKSETAEDPEVLMFNSYFASSGQDANSKNEAMDLIEQSKYSQMLMSKVLSSDAAVSLFDNPELLDY